MQKKGVETLIQQVQTTAANPVESEQIDLPEVVLQPLPMNAKVAEQHHFAHGLLEEMLFKRGIFKPYFMGEGKHGKPFLLEHPQIQFNISHCKNAVLCGIGSKPLGVDVETIRPMRERVLRRVLTASEQQEILQSESPELYFFAVLDTKKSFVKALGVGISYPMQTLAFSLREPLCNGRNAVPCTAWKRRDSCSNAGICRSRSRCRIPLLSRHLGTEASLFRLYSQGRITEKRN